MKWDRWSRSVFGGKRKENKTTHMNVKEEILNKYSYQIEEHLIDWFKYVEGFPKEKRIHMYLYFENERKFFANEI